MRAIIVAGGSSSRFWPLGKCHKALTTVCGKSVIERTVDNLPDVEELVIVEPPSRCISENLDVDAIFRVQREPRGMWDAISIGARDYAGDVIVVSGHQFDRNALSKLAKGSDTKLLLSEVPNPEEYGVVTVEDGRAIGIIEKPAEPESNLVVNSAYRLSRDLVRDVVSSPGNDHYRLEKVISSYLAERPAEYELVPKSSMPSLKYPWDAIDVMEKVLDSVGPEVHGDVSESAKIEGPVFVNEGAVVMSGAQINGPAYIGRGAIIGTSSLIRQSSIEAGAVVGYGSEVARSLIGPGSRLHHTFIGDSVLGRDSWFGFGVTTANRRFDRSEIKVRVKGELKATSRGKFGCATGVGSRVGVGSLIMPGTLIGAGATVGPGTIVDEHVPDGKTMYTVQKKVVK